MQFPIAGRYTKLEILECLAPLAAGPVVIGQGYTFVCITYPIHEAQSYLREELVVAVIFDYDCSLCYTRCLAKEYVRVVGVMQYVNEHHDVGTVVVKRDAVAIKGLDFNVCTTSYKYVHPG
jgi:hypothetical protein